MELDIFYALNKLIKTFNLLQSKLLFWIPAVLSKLCFQKILLVSKCRSNLSWQNLRKNQHKAMWKKECLFELGFVHDTRESAVECNSTW